MALRIVGGLAVVLWWAPAILLALVGLWGGRLRFHTAIGLGRALVGIGALGAARAVFAHEAARCRRRAAAGQSSP